MLCQQYCKKTNWKLWTENDLALDLVETKLFSIKLAWQDMIVISCSVLNYQLNLLLVLVYAKHHVLYVVLAVAMLGISLVDVSFTIRLLTMMCFTSARLFTWDFRVRKIAHELGHTKLRAKLSEDMVAVETVYHSNCLIKLYNRYRSHNNWKLSDRNKMMIQGKFMRKRAWKFSRHRKQISVSVFALSNSLVLRYKANKLYMLSYIYILTLPTCTNIVA